MEIKKFIIEGGELKDCKIEYDLGTGDVIIPEGVLEIGPDFLGLYGVVEHLHISASVVKIHSGAFSGCERITTITVDPDNTVYHVSGNCIIDTVAKKLVVGGSNPTIASDGTVTEIGAYAFNCRKIQHIEIPNTITSINFMAFSWTELTDLLLPDSLEFIDSHAFALNNHLTSVHIPKSVTKMGNGVFTGCNKLNSITVVKNNPVYKDYENCIIETNTMSLIAACNNSVIPEGVKCIPDFTITMLDNCESIYVPESVVEIGQANFELCYKFYEDENGNKITRRPKFTIKSKAGSHAITFAKSKNIPYEEIRKIGQI